MVHFVTFFFISMPIAQLRTCLFSLLQSLGRPACWQPNPSSASPGKVSRWQRRSLFSLPSSFWSVSFHKKIFFFQFFSVTVSTCIKRVRLTFPQNCFLSVTVTLASAKTILRNEQSEDEYDYYQVPVYGHSGYDTGSSGSSSYASGYSKRSIDVPAFMNLPVVQRLTERIHQAIENYSAQN